MFLSNGSGKESGPNIHRASQHVLHLGSSVPISNLSLSAADAMSIGSHVGFTLLGDGSLWRVLGLLIDLEEQEVVVAIPTGFVDADCKGSVGDIEVSFVRVDSGEVTENCVWPATAQLSAERKKTAQLPVWPGTGSVFKFTAARSTSPRRWTGTAWCLQPSERMQAWLPVPELPEEGNEPHPSHWGPPFWGYQKRGTTRKRKRT